MKLFLWGLILVIAFSTQPAFAERGDNEKWEECARLAQSGDADAQYRMGKIYQEGKLVVSDPSEAFYWFKKSASNGNGDACYEVGRCFRYGYGVIPDNRIAAENFWRAAEKGSAEGAYCYAEMLRDGVGVPTDKAKAYKWFAVASKSDYADAAKQAESLKAFSGSGKASKSTPSKIRDNKKHVKAGVKHSSKAAMRKQKHERK